MEKREFDLYEKLFDSFGEGVQNPDLYIYLYAKPPVIVARIRERARSYEMQMLREYPHYLTNLDASVQSFINHRKNVITVDTTRENAIDEIHINGLVEKIRRNI